MELVPVLQAQYQAAQGGLWGLVRQVTHVTGDNLASLLGGTDTTAQNVFFETNTGRVILQPVLRPRDFGLAETPTVTGSGSWRDTLNPSTGKRGMVQYKAEESIEWSRETGSSFLATENAPFSISLYLGAPPLATPTAERKGSDIYRRVTWASDSDTGENRWRVTFPYQAKPYLERSTDAGSTWTHEGELDSSIDLESLYTAKNIRITLSVMTVGDEMVVWLGEGFNRGGKVIYKNAGYPAGSIKVEGKGGYTFFTFSDIRFKKTGYFISYRHPGPRDMATPTPSLYLWGTSSDDLDAASQTMAGAIENTYAATYEFDYRVTLTSPALASPDDDYSATTPYLQHVTIVWPMIYDAPPSGSWTDFQPHAYREKLTFDPSSRILRRSCSLTGRVYGTERHPVSGVEALRVYLDYQHEYNPASPTLRSYFIGNTEAEFFSMGRDAFVTYHGQDLLWLLEPQYLTLRVFPSRWCVYAVVRLLLESGGIVPELQATLKAFIQQGNDSNAVCAFGPEPEGCNHTKFPLHPGWPELTGILPALMECKDVEHAWMGQDEEGQFRFEPFDPDAFTTVEKRFLESASGDGSDYDEIGSADAPSLRRFRSVSGVKNEITLIGVDQSTGAFLPKQYRDDASIETRGAVNYTGGARRFTWASSLFVDDAFTQNVLDKTAKWARLPYEAVAFQANGQPALQPMHVIEAREGRALGPYPVPYMITDIETVIEAPGKPTSWITGIWTGLGAPPGIDPTPPPPVQRVSPKEGAIPAEARRGRGNVTIL